METIYYNVNQEPDVGLPLAQLGTIDIADPIKQRYVEVLSQQTINAQNSIPIAPNSSVGRFYETPDPEQIQYISNDGKLYLINTNMDVIFTGAKTDNEE